MGVDNTLRWELGPKGLYWHYGTSVITTVTKLEVFSTWRGYRLTIRGVRIGDYDTFVAAANAHAAATNPVP